MSATARLLLGLAVLCTLRLRHTADGADVEATVVTVTGSKYDTRGFVAEDDFKGCYLTGCLPELTSDGLLNDVLQSRWSCSDDLPPQSDDCYVTFDLGSSESLSKMTIYFHWSNLTDREPNRFNISTSTAGVLFEPSFESVNVAGTPIGAGEDFAFPAGSTARYVRLTGDLNDGQWLSVNEVFIFVEGGTSSPTSVLPMTSAPTVSITTSPTTAAPSGVTTAPTVLAPTLAPSPTSMCVNVTVSNGGGLNGLYVPSTAADGTISYSSTGTTSAATISSAEATAACATTSMTDCTSTKWSVTPTDETLPTYFAFDEAEHPAEVTEIWLRPNCSSSPCTNFPSNLEIVCADGSGVTSTTPAPVGAASDCGVLDLSGTFDVEADGFYYEINSLPEDVVALFAGYDVDASSDLIRNDNTVKAESINGTCLDTTSASACTWRRWSIEVNSSGSSLDNYFTYDEADNPIDIATDTIWYTSDSTVMPYSGTIGFVCADATAPARTTPTPTSITRAPVDMGPSSPSITDNQSKSSSGGSGDTAVIVGSVVGGVALLAIVAVVGYKMKKVSAPPPPSYDDIVGA